MSSNSSAIYSAIGADGSAIAGGGVAAVPLGSSADNSDGGWLSGLGSLFGNVASGVANIVKATNTPTPQPVYALPQSVYTPQNVNPSLTSVTSLLFNPIILIVVLLGVIFLVKKK